MKKKKNAINRQDMQKDLDKEFSDFLREQFFRASLKKEFVDDLVKDLDPWKICFVHKNVDQKNNYENYEFYGDKIVSSAAASFIQKKYGDKIKAPVWLTKIYHHIVSSKILAKVGEQVGFSKFIKVNRELIREEMNKKKVPTYIPIEKHKIFMSIIEDTVEAFFGCMSTLLEKRLSRGASLEICTRILHSYYRSVTIDISYENLFDPVTRLKELYQQSLKWFETIPGPDGRKRKTVYLEETVKEAEDGSNLYTYTVYGWMKTKEITERNKKPISSSEGWDPDVTRNEAARKALAYLRDALSVFPQPPAQK